MKTTPMGRMSSEKVFIAPVVVAASAEAPRWATMTASETPTTTWADRETTMGQASARSVPSPGRGAGPGRGGRPRIIDGLPGRVSASQEATSMSSGTGGT